MKGSEILIKALLDEGVDTVFGYPGGAVLDIYDALFYHPEIKHILTSHEQGAAHAADGYARSTGKVGVCIATSGPGATNLVTGIATAYMDSVPLVCITGNVSKGLLGKDSFQEVDIAGVTMPVTKHNFIVKDVKCLNDIVHRAFAIAKEGRPGPVLVDITSDTISSECSEIKTYVHTKKEYNLYDNSDIKTSAKLIANARKPLLYVGGGAKSASGEIIRLAYSLGSPVCDSLMGKGVFSGDEKGYLGMLGIHGTESAREAVSTCDLLIAVGVRFSDRATGYFKSISSHTKIVHIDIDPAELNKNIPATVTVSGDASKVLYDINEALDNIISTKGIHAIRDWYIKKPVEEKESDSLYYIKEINKIAGDCIIVTEVGKHQMNVASYYCFKRPGRLLTSGGLGTMGYGLGAAIGAKTGNPSEKVINIAGDGSFRMNMNELITAVKYKIPIVEIVFNNHSLGLVRELQDILYDGRHAYTDLDDETDYVKLAEAMGACGARVTERLQFANVLNNALKSCKPYLIEVCIND